MKSHSTRNPVVGCGNKVMSLAAFTFFLSLTASQAQFNRADGNVYGHSNVVLTATTINSILDGSSNLDVLFPTTDRINLNHSISGYISISNNFDGFNISSTPLSTVTGTNSFGLMVNGGTNLNITSGVFSGGVTTTTTNDWKSSVGGILIGVHTTQVSNVRFNGGTIETVDLSTGLPPIPGQTNSAGYEAPVAMGTHAMMVIGSTNLTFQDASIFQGGAGKEADSSKQNAYANGGTGLMLQDSSVIISNGTYSGGAGGTATTSGSNKASANGGHGLYASNSVVSIHEGTFTGGAPGTTNTKSGSGGTGLTAIDGSSVTISNGNFIGISAPAVALRNATLTTYGGTYTSGGLYSETTGSNTSHVNLIGGTFSSLSFINGTSNGTQYIEANSNLVVSVDVFQNGGTVAINNASNHVSDHAFQQVTILDGSMVFSNDFALTTGGSFTLSNANSMAFFQGLEIQDGGTFDIGLGQFEADGLLDVKDGAILKFKVVTNTWGDITASTATFESNSTIIVDASLAGFGTGTNNITLLTTSGGINGDFTNGVVTDVQTTTDTNIIGRTKLDGILVGNDLIFVFNTATLSDHWNATGQLAALAGELDIINDPVMNAIINNMGADASKALVEENYLTTMNTFQIAKQGLDAAVGLALSRGTEFREQQQLPKGAEGPDEENDWRFWAKYYGQFYHRNQQDLNPEYDAIIHGGVIGMDKSYGPLLVGISGGAGNYSINTENDAEQNMNAFQAALYSTIGKNHSYLDAGLAVGFNSVESHTAKPLQMDGEFDTQLLSAYLGGGIGFEFPGIGTVITPEASIRYTAYQQDSYEEKSTVAVPRSFEEFDADSLAGTFGLNAAMLNTSAMESFAFRIEGRAHWIREFNPEPGDISYQLVGGNNDYLIAYPFLDEDTIRLGVGFTFFNTKRNAQENVLLRLDFDELFGEDFNSHNLSAKVIYAF